MNITHDVKFRGCEPNLVSSQTSIEATLSPMSSGCRHIGRDRLCLLLVIQVVLIVAGSSNIRSDDDNWPQFRGPSALGIGPGTPPLQWDVDSGTNVEWKTRIPGLGHSSPIVWGNHIFLTTAVNSETDAPSLQTGWLGGTGKSPTESGDWTWQLLCIERDSGDLLWTRNLHHGQPVFKRHLKASHANCTPATDGTHVVAFFGSEGLHCYDFDGQLLWKREPGRLHSGPYDDPTLEWGFSSSPIIFDGKVIIQCDCLNTNFVAIYDITNGNEIRRIDRGNEVSTWSTPAIVQTIDRTQIVCNGYRQMAGYDFQTGERLWHLSGGGDIPVPTPLFANGLIYLTNGHKRSPTFVIKPTASGDLTPRRNKTSEGLAWSQSKDGAYMPTPLVKDDLIYTCDDNGRLTVRDALTGALVYRQRVGSGSRTYSASAVAANGHIYFSSERGEVTVVTEGRKFEKAASNELGEAIMATPAISGNRLIVRGVQHLFSLKSDQADSDAGE